jgi:hypothetical protein
MSSTAPAPSTTKTTTIPSLTVDQCRVILSQYFKRVPVLADGNCLFASLVELFPHHNFNIPYLRHCVATRFLNPDDTLASKTLLNWVDLFRILKHEFESCFEQLKRETDTAKAKDIFDTSLFETVWHMRLFPDLHTINVNMTEAEMPILITPQQRKFIYDVVMTREFWAEEFTLSTLSQMLKCAFIIVDGNRIPYSNTVADNFPLSRPTASSDNFPLSRLAVPAMHSEATVYQALRGFVLRNTETTADMPESHVWLYLSAKHYQPLFFQGV